MTKLPSFASIGAVISSKSTLEPVLSAGLALCYDRNSVSQAIYDYVVRKQVFVLGRLPIRVSIYLHLFRIFF